MSCWIFQTECSIFIYNLSFSFGIITRNEKLSRVLEQVVEIGLRGGWGEFQDTPLRIPRIQLPPHLGSSSSTSPVQDPPLEPEHSNPSSSSLPPLKGSQMDVSTSGGGGGTESGSSS